MELITERMEYKERINIPESEEKRQWLEKQNFKNTAEDAYTG